MAEDALQVGGDIALAWGPLWTFVFLVVVGLALGIYFVLRNYFGLVARVTSALEGNTASNTQLAGSVDKLADRIR